MNHKFRYSRLEVSRLLEYSKSAISWKALAQQVPSRSYSSIRRKLAAMKIPSPRTRKFWTITDITRLTELYPLMGVRCAKALGRSTGGVKRKAQDLGLRLHPEYRRGNFKDISGLKFHYGIRALKRSRYNGHVTYWTCQCRCGNLFETSLYKLTSGLKTSCGCANSKRKPA